MLHIPPTRLATHAEVSLVHNYLPDLLEKSSTAMDDTPVELADLDDPDGVTYLTPSTLSDAYQAVGASLHAVDIIMSSTSAVNQQPRHAFVIARPPGHHATPDTPLGYCIFNTIAITARYLQQNYKDRVSKIAIVDFDVHNGNGTAEAFWHDDSIFVVDIHESSAVYSPPEFVPCGVQDIGDGPGRGFTMNVPLPRHAGHECVAHVFEEVILPGLERFCPDMVLISAGFDAHVMDPFQLLQYNSSTYHYMVRRLKQVAERCCHGRMLLVLEGGYNVDALGESVCEAFLALLGEKSREESRGSGEVMHVPHEEPLDAVKEMTLQLKQIHSI